MKTLPETFDGPVHVAIVGGTGLSSLPYFTPVAELPLSHPSLQTPWGSPSSPITILTLPSSRQGEDHSADDPTAAGTTPSPTATAKPINIAFLTRHGLHHEYAPHEVPSQANIAALKKIGVRCIVAFSAVGSLQEDIRPKDFVMPDQVLDNTKGVRPFTYFERGVVAHVPFAEPFDNDLRSIMRLALDESPEAMESSSTGETEAAAADAPKIHPQGTLVCMEGPQFSTRAESHLYRSRGASVINMSCLPEAKLAREAEMSYAMVCMSTDYDCWKQDMEGGGDVNVEMVMANMKSNIVNAGRVINVVLKALSLGLNDEKDANTEVQEWKGVDVERVRKIVNGEKWKGQSMRGLTGMSADPNVRSEVRAKLKWLFEDWEG